MNDDFIVTVYVVIDTVMRASDHRSHRLAHISDAEVLTVAVVAARYFQHHHERALQIVQRLNRSANGIYMPHSANHVGFTWASV